MIYRLRVSKAFADWADALKDNRAATALAKRLKRLVAGHFGDAKMIGDGVRELRIHHGPGYRVYFQIRQGEIILLLCGGDKSSQKHDIEKARQLAQTWSD